MKHFLFIGFLSWASITLMGQGVGDATAMRFRYLVHEEQFEKAIELAKDQNLTSSNDPLILKSVLEMQMNLGEVDAAISTTNKLIPTNPAFAYYMMAKIELQKRDIPKAISFLRKHLEQDAHHPGSFIKLDPDFEGLDLQRDWINLWKENWYTPQEEKISEGEYYINQGDIETAETIGQTIIQDDPNNPNGWFLISRIRFHQERKREADDAMDRALQKGHGDVGFLEPAFNWLSETSQFEKAVNVCLQLRKSDPSNPEYLVWLVMARLNSGQESTGMREMDILEGLGVESVELSYLAGKSVMDRDPGKALILLDKAIGSGKLDKRYFNNRADIQIRLSHEKAAMADLSMSLDLDPNQVDIWFSRAQLRYDSGNQEGACHDWERALQLGHKLAADKLYKFCRNY